MMIKKAAVKVIEFMMSYDIQKKLVIEKDVFTAMKSVYNDKEDYVEYSKHFRENVYEFLYGDKTAYEVLKK
ncbi:hypothetical protein PIROE2DRAFT_8307 [Piromyces sp. E2]|nr:hypothetical protein PIROE2DRAFT_8307 [Piromyces sp. E2]|eukprot:OUM64842.1 hypothetical protein PIROE2DRAFT_8307 [Piromyces sp. E2]